jgi:hypothetical protein
MPSSAILEFNDPDACRAAIREAYVAGIVTERGLLRAELRRPRFARR